MTKERENRSPPPLPEPGKTEQELVSELRRLRAWFKEWKS